jgi:hypothetical protein
MEYTSMGGQARPGTEDPFAPNVEMVFVPPDNFDSAFAHVSNFPGRDCSRLTLHSPLSTIAQEQPITV